MTHAGHSYAGRGSRDMARIAEAERAAVTRAAARLREAGYAIDIVSAGSSPTARHAGQPRRRDGNPGRRLHVRRSVPGRDRHPRADAIAVTVLTSVIGRRPGRVLVDAGGLALSKDRSTEATPHDYGFGLALDIDGSRGLGNAVVRKAYQEHGVIELDPAHPVDLPIGAKLAHRAQSHLHDRRGA